MQFSKNSRVWIYQSDKELTDSQTQQVQEQLNQFTQSWTAHNNELKAGAAVKYNRFLILVVDESQAGASGCSIDKSVRVMKELEQQYNINLFDRFNLAYRDGDNILSVPRNEFEELIKTGKINAGTIVYNNLVQTLDELQTKWEVPLQNSWHVQLFGNLLTTV
ncbi:ABC transporter ATPase [Mucilaginibacter terrae]|uniref:HTH domain antitoxin n=1 Tax=Mucilaginibacter terrae TaxID=1955052 RepID=A0ABU3GYB9_9SPHI|nr:ABC transporter ATPase [Mucilaginibacter terrae]MDT3404754.1 putative HTH domain antitoxin [Mucilaginibacter terrae]